VTVTERGVGIKGRLAADPRFFAKTDEKPATTYLRILDDKYTKVGTDENDKPIWDTELVGFDLEVTGPLAVAIADGSHKGDLLVVIADKDEWTAPAKGSKAAHEKVTYHVKAAGLGIAPNGDAHKAARGVSADAVQAVAAGPATKEIDDAWFDKERQRSLDGGASFERATQEAHNGFFLVHKRDYEADETDAINAVQAVAAGPVTNPYPDALTPNFGPSTTPAAGGAVVSQSVA
jgi:hypothetical protein